MFEKLKEWGKRPGLVILHKDEDIMEYVMWKKPEKFRHIWNK